MIGIFLGGQNSGKTLAMTYFAKDYYNKGYSIYSNYNLNFPHKKITKKLIEDYVKAKKQFNRAVFLIDEIYLILDSRGFMKNKVMSYFILQTSKRDVNLFGTAQFFNTTDLRLRDNTNFMVFCERVNKIKNKFYPVKSNRRFLDLNNILYIKMNFISKNKGGLMETMDIKTHYLKAEKIFNLYDTTELLGLED